MFRMGLITDGISQDFEHALGVMDELGLKYVEIQSLWGKKVGSLTPKEIKGVKDLIVTRDMKVSCISPLLFFRTPLLAEPDEKSYWGSYSEDVETLKRCIEIAKELGTNLVRVFSFGTETVLFGSEILVADGVWGMLVKKFEELVEIAEKENVILVVETGIFSNIATAALAKKLIDELGSENLRILWDPCSALYCHELPYPIAYQLIRDHIAHIHLKDGVVDRPMATFDFCPFGQGQMETHLPEILRALKEDRYQGTLSFEHVYVPEKGTKEDELRRSAATLKKIIGAW